MTPTNFAAPSLYTATPSVGPEIVHYAYPCGDTTLILEDQLDWKSAERIFDCAQRDIDEVITNGATRAGMFQMLLVGTLLLNLAILM